MTDFSRPHTFSGRRASQSQYELSSFINLLNEKGVKRYLEIGARDGDTFYDVMASLPKGSYGLALDLPGGLWGKSTTSENLKKAVMELRRKGYDAHYIFGDSQSKEVIEQVKEEAPFDAALIDGDHTLFGVTKDWNNYKSMASIIAFHDIVGQGQRERVTRKEVEVPILWEKIKKDHVHFEFIEKDSKMGIGCLLL